jgi:hypothetical protein
MKLKQLMMATLVTMALIGAAGAARAEGVRMFVRHEVADYAAWKKAYDSFRPVQKKNGVTYQAIYRSIDDPNDVTVLHDFASLEKAKAFAAPWRRGASRALPRSGSRRGAASSAPASGIPWRDPAGRAAGPRSHSAGLGTQRSDFAGAAAALGGDGAPGTASRVRNQ